MEAHAEGPHELLASQVLGHWTFGDGMSILGYRAKRASTPAVCLITLPVFYRVIFRKHITSPSPTGTWAAAGNGAGLSPPRAAAPTVHLQDGPILIAELDHRHGAPARTHIHDRSKAVAATYIYSFTFTAERFSPGTATEEREN
jgi:hypothetical protein